MFTLFLITSKTPTNLYGQIYMHCGCSGHRYRECNLFHRRFFFFLHYRNRENDDEVSPFIKGLHFRDYDNPIDLMFDPSKFKANKSVSIRNQILRFISLILMTDKVLSLPIFKFYLCGVTWYSAPSCLYIVDAFNRRNKADTK